MPILISGEGVNTNPFPMSSWGAELYERLRPLAYADATNDYALLFFCDAIGRMYEDLHDLVSESDDGPPWSQLLDVERTPAAQLPHLAQYVGARIPVGTPEVTAREMVRHPAGWSRGTKASMIAAAQLYLTGNKTVGFYERNGGDAYALLVTTRTSETSDPAKTEAAIRAVKPVGIVMTYAVVTGLLVDELAGTVDGLAGTVDSLA